MKKWLSVRKWYVAGALLGAAVGFTYWYFVGCDSGTCLITGQPVNSTLYGGTLGALILGMLGNEINLIKQKKQSS